MPDPQQTAPAPTQATIPIPGMGNDPTGSVINPHDLLNAIATGRLGVLGGMPQTQGSISPIPSIPQPSLRSPVPIQGPAGVAQGEFSTKGGHQRASMQSLQSTVASAVNQLNAHENKIIQQKTDAYTQAVMGIGQAKEKLAQDPNNVEAQQQLQRDQQFLQAFLDPTTPEGKKNIKLLEKAYPQAQPEEQTKETQAAQASTRKAQQQQRLQQMSQAFQSGNAFPRTMQPSPLTQVEGQLVKAGLVPKPATGGQILNAATGAAKTLQQSDDKQAALDAKAAAQKERLGLDDKGLPKPLDQLPLKDQAKIASERASDELKAAQAQFDQAKTQALKDPNSIQNQLALMRANAMRSFASASNMRAQAMMLNYQMNALGTGPDGQPLPGSTSIGGQTVGARLASQAVKTIQTQAQFIDADGAVDNLTAAIKSMQSTGQRLNDSRLTKLMSDPHFTGSKELFDNWISSNAISSGLSPEQREYMIAQKQARENIMAIRKVIGTGVSVSAMNAITSTLPGAQTPDADYALRQIQAVKGQLNRLQQGVPQINIPSRTNQPGAGPGGGAPAGPLTNDERKAVNW